MLTRKQQELLLFIHERMKESGVPPSFDEMKDALDLASKSGIHRLITALEERGFIRRLPNRARALEVIKLPEAYSPSIQPRRGFSPSVIEGSLGKPQPAAAAPKPANEDNNSSVSVPCSWAVLRQACRSRRSRTTRTTSTFRPICSAPANTMRLRSRAIR